MRVGAGRRGTPGERGLTAEAPAPDALLRPALEAAWLVARASEQATPGSAPKRLRPLLGHARLTAAALHTVRRVVEDDEQFRSTVATATDEEAVGRAGWLFLVRPEGWEDELAALAAVETESSQAEQAAREERSAARRLRGAEDALRRAEDALAEARSHAARAAGDLADERRSRRTAEEEAQALSDRVAALERDRAAAVARADGLATLATRVAELEAALAEARRAQPPTVPQDVLDVLADAADTARALADRLAAAVASFREEAVVRPAPPPPPAPDAPPGRVRRRPVPLPPGIRGDTVEAAEHLVRRRGALLLVDGYNASLRYRPDLPIPELRQRFVDALDELAARTGVDVHVVFDGALQPDGTVVAASSRRGRARVTFSPPDIEADDVILDLVDGIPLDRAVLVASDDRRVRDGADERGANVLSTTQLLAVLRREREA